MTGQTSNEDPLINSIEKSSPDVFGYVGIGCGMLVLIAYLEPLFKLPWWQIATVFVLTVLVGWLVLKLLKLLFSALAEIWKLASIAVGLRIIRWTGTVWVTKFVANKLKLSKSPSPIMAAIWRTTILYLFFLVPILCLSTIEFVSRKVGYELPFASYILLFFIACPIVISLFTIFACEYLRTELNKYRSGLQKKEEIFALGEFPKKESFTLYSWFQRSKWLIGVFAFFHKGLQHFHDGILKKIYEEVSDDKGRDEWVLSANPAILIVSMLVLLIFSAWLAYFVFNTRIYTEFVFHDPENPPKQFLSWFISFLGASIVTPQFPLQLNAYLIELDLFVQNILLTSLEIGRGQAMGYISPKFGIAVAGGLGSYLMIVFGIGLKGYGLRKLIVWRGELRESVEGVETLIKLNKKKEQNLKEQSPEQEEMLCKRIEQIEHNLLRFGQTAAGVLRKNIIEISSVEKDSEIVRDKANDERDEEDDQSSNPVWDSGTRLILQALIRLLSKFESDAYNAVPDLLEILGKGGDELKNEVVEAIKRIGFHANAAHHEMLKIAKEGSGKVQLDAIKALGNFKSLPGKDALDYLGKLSKISEKDGELQKAAKDAISKMETEHAANLKQHATKKKQMKESEVKDALEIVGYNDKHAELISNHYLGKPDVFKDQERIIEILTNYDTEDAARGMFKFLNTDAEQKLDQDVFNGLLKTKSYKRIKPEFFSDIVTNNEKPKFEKLFSDWLSKSLKSGNRKQAIRSFGGAVQEKAKETKSMSIDDSWKNYFSKMDESKRTELAENLMSYFIISTAETSWIQERPIWMASCLGKIMRPHLSVILEKSYDWTCWDLKNIFLEEVVGDPIDDAKVIEDLDEIAFKATESGSNPKQREFSENIYEMLGEKTEKYDLNIKVIKSLTKALPNKFQGKVSVRRKIIYSLLRQIKQLIKQLIEDRELRPEVGLAETFVDLGKAVEKMGEIEKTKGQLWLTAVICLNRIFYDLGRFDRKPNPKWIFKKLVKLCNSEPSQHEEEYKGLRVDVAKAIRKIFENEKNEIHVKEYLKDKDKFNEILIENKYKEILRENKFKEILSNEKENTKIQEWLNKCVVQSQLIKQTKVSLRSRCLNSLSPPLSLQEKLNTLKKEEETEKVALDSDRPAMGVDGTFVLSPTLQPNLGNDRKLTSLAKSNQLQLHS